MAHTTVPAFPPVTVTTSPPASSGPGLPPRDCTQLLTAAQVVAQLGLPLDTVTVATILDVAAAGRELRVVCTYTRLSPAQPGVVLRIVVTTYTSTATAATQARVNAAAETRDASRSTPVALGAASATVFTEPAATVLLARYGRYTVAVSLPSLATATLDPRPAPAAVVTDLVDRVLATLPPAPGP